MLCELCFAGGVLPEPCQAGPAAAAHLAAAAQLTHASLSSCVLDDATVLSISARGTSLRRLDISYNKHVMDAGLAGIASMGSSPHRAARARHERH